MPAYRYVVRVSSLRQISIDDVITALNNTSDDLWDKGAPELESRAYEQLAYHVTVARDEGDNLLKLIEASSSYPAIVSKLTFWFTVKNTTLGMDVERMLRGVCTRFLEADVSVQVKAE